MYIKNKANLTLTNDALKRYSFKTVKFFDLQNTNDMDRSIDGEEYA